jgi:hypothetical protein
VGLWMWQVGRLPLFEPGSLWKLADEEQQCRGVGFSGAAGQEVLQKHLQSCHCLKLLQDAFPLLDAFVLLYRQEDATPLLHNGLQTVNACKFINLGLTTRSLRIHPPSFHS